MTPAKSRKDLFDSIVDGKFTKDGSELEVNNLECNNTTLTSLEGLPESVAGNFSCYKNPELTSLVGAPQTVHGGFSCGNNEKLTSLVGAPESVRYCDFQNNPKLPSLLGSPQIIHTYFNCANNPNLESLEGAPKTVGSWFWCSNNPKLTSLARINFYIHEIKADADFAGCPIKSNILGLLKIRGLKFVTFDDKKLEAIMNKYLPMGDSTDCIDDLLDAGYSKEYCKW